MAQGIIIADDLTGAADTGVAFARGGLIALARVTPDVIPPADVDALSTHSRDHSEEASLRVVSQTAAWVRKTHPEEALRWVYKKVDSTLRGHPGTELAAVMRALDIDRALVAPAFPAQNRTTVDGRQLVSGRPLEDTPFGKEVSTSDVVRLFQVPLQEHPVRHIPLQTVRRGVEAVQDILSQKSAAVWIADAKSEDDLYRLAQAAIASSIRLLCGSAGLARALAQVLPLRREVARPDLPSPPRGPILVIAGSRHPMVARQVKQAHRRGAVVIRPSAAFRGLRITAARVAQHLAAGRDVVLTTAEMSDSPLGKEAVAAHLGEIARHVVEQVPVGGMILTGGDIAVAVCKALEGMTIWLQGEIERGIPWGRWVDGIATGMPVVTKAGGFGKKDVLARAIELLRQRIREAQK